MLRSELLSLDVVRLPVADHVQLETGRVQTTVPDAQVTVVVGIQPER